MADRWFTEHRRDPWRRQAKSSGYRSRSAYKLLQCQNKFQLIRPGDVVVDVGCHPGGWTQVAVEQVGEDGLVIGVDLEPCAPIEGSTLIVGDVTEKEVQANIEESLEGRAPNSIVSDISPKLTGRYEMDQAISIELVCMVMDYSFPMLAPGGSFLTKVFQGRGIESLVDAAKAHFSKVQRFSPVASRNSSSEVYLVCKNKLPQPRKWARGKTVFELVQESLTEAGFVTDGGEDEEFTGKVGFSVHRSKK